MYGIMRAFAGKIVEIIQQKSERLYIITIVAETNATGLVGVGHAIGLIGKVQKSGGVVGEHLDRNFWNIKTIKQFKKESYIDEFR